MTLRCNGIMLQFLDPLSAFGRLRRGETWRRRGGQRERGRGREREREREKEREREREGGRENNEK